MKIELDAVRRKLAATYRSRPPEDIARVGEALQPQACLLDAVATNGENALRVVAELIGEARGLSPTLVFDALWRREQAGSTALGAGFAIPHARLPGIERALTVFVRLRDAIPFGAADGIPVSCFLVIIVPRDGADGDHLRMLSLIADLLSTRSFRRQIETVSTADVASAVFQRGIAKSIRGFRPSDDPS